MTNKSSSQHYFTQANQVHNTTVHKQIKLPTLLYRNKPSSQHYFTQANQVASTVVLWTWFACVK
jgi:hypothetical protein